MKLENVNPFLRYAKMHKYYQEQKINSICYDCRLFFIVQGDGSVFANGQNYNVSNNTLIYFPPKTHYNFKFKDNSGVIIYVINFDLTDKFSHVTHSVGTATEETFNHEKLLDYPLPIEFTGVIVKNNCLSIGESVKACVDLFMNKSAYYKEISSAHLKMSLINLLQQVNKESSEYKLVETVQDYIRMHYDDTELTNEKIATHFNYHPYHLSRLMKAHTKKTLHNYLIDFRLHMAKNYLTTTNYNVTKIAEKTGFPSYAYFIKIFRERVGISPLQYRKTHLSIGF